MNLKKIVIYQNQVLFDILKEIKDKFKVELFKAEENNLEKIINEFKTDFLIISVKDNIGHKNELILDKIPIKIENLFEQVNLRLLKEKFNYQSDISVGAYRLNLNSRKLSKNNKMIDLTEREVNLIIFLKNSTDAVKIDELQRKVWDYGPELETHTVETHIYRLRKKVKENFKDDNFIISLKKGYLIS